MKTCELLQYIAPFSTLEPATRDKIESLFQLRTFSKDALLLQEDREVTQIGYVVSGNLSIERCSEGGIPRPNGSLTVGEYYGLMALVDRGLSIIDLVATRPTTCYTIDRVDFVDMLTAYPEISAFFENAALARLGSLYFQTHSAPMPGGEPIISKGSKKLQRSLEYIETQYMGTITLDAVAAINGLSRYHYSRIFKHTVGCSFKEYLNRTRIKAAKRMMDNPDMNVSQICYAVGFNDVSYFARVFKKMEGTSPSVYRKALIRKKKPVTVGMALAPDLWINRFHGKLNCHGPVLRNSLVSG
ncbi:MAG: helix-turn-helix domain-containing protein [Desulfobacterium sp.]|nr:helix-turn-helix domain-containing protein [Desulfobacterium sp.]